MDVTALKIGEPEGLVAELAPRLQASRTVEEACTLLCSEIYERCRSGPNGERSLVLSRIYLSLPFASLDAGGADFARRTFHLTPGPRDLFLALLGTHGDAPEWRDRKSSNGHRTIPLNRQTVTTVPMVARCFQQIGFDLEIVLKGEQGIHLEGVSQSFGMFHVEEVPGSPYVPAQENFVKPYGVRSAVGCGAMLPNGAVSIWIGFSRHAIPQRAALPLVPLMPSFWHAIQPLYRRRTFFAS